MENKPSATALRSAMRRAAHQLLDEPLIYEDPLALQIIGGDRGSAIARDEFSRANSVGGAALRLFLAARSRYSDDRLASAVSRGVRPAVLLGAGLETLGYRNPFAAEGLVVYEVDHPATQEWKRQQLAAAGIAIPPGVIYVPFDFASGDLGAALAAAGLDPAAPAFFSWLGVVPYLPEDAMLATLRAVAARAGAVEIVLDYAEPPGRFGRLQRLAFEKLAGRVASLGEPFVSFFTVDEMDERLAGLGFTEMETLSGPELGSRYLGGPSPLDRAAIGHIVAARRD